MLYTEMSYRDLQSECKERGINGKGSIPELIDRLTNDDLGNPPELKKKAKKVPKGLKPTDPNPDNPNWDMAGRWIRR